MFQTPKQTNRSIYLCIEKGTFKLSRQICKIDNWHHSVRFKVYVAFI